MKILAEIENALRDALAEPGLVPHWCTGTRGAGPADGDARAKLDRMVGDTGLAARPARTWDPVLAQAWIAGMIYLRDQASRVSEHAELTAKSLIVRGSRIEAYATVGGDRVAILDSKVGAHSVLEGPLALVDTRFAPYVILGPFVVLLASGIQHFGKVQRFVRVERSLIGSNVSIEGGTHPEIIPLGPQHRGVGVTVARDCWIGQGCSLTAGAELGPGVVVAPNTSVTRTFAELVFVAGTPARAHPIDFAIRSLSPEEAFAEGQRQGHYAVGMPMFGPGQGAWSADRRTIELAYPRHAVVRGLASEAALHFHRGVLATTFAAMFPDYTAAIRARVGAGVRFEIELDRPFVEHAVPAPDLVIRRRDGADPDALPIAARALLDRISPAGATLAALGATEAVRRQVHALALDGHVEPALFRRATNAGMVEPNPEPAVLASRWRLLVDPAAPPLPAFVEATAPAPRASSSPGPAAAPGDTFAALAALVRRLAGTDGAVDIDAPLYQLGIDSIARAELGALVETQLGVSVDIFAERSLRTLAAAIERARPKS